MAYQEFKCVACDLPEDRCTCDRFCALCYSEYQVRLCEDGQYYCSVCREVCDYKAQDPA